jgi:hypothetical protein
MDKPKFLDTKRKSAMRRIFKRASDIFICSLTPLCSTSSRWERQMTYISSLNKYQELKKKDALPIFCKVLDNIADGSREVLRAEAKSDPVYNFLFNVKQRLYDIASSQYSRGADFREVDSGSQDYEVYLSNKKNFLDGLMGSFELRGGGRNTLSDWSLAAKVNTEGRYIYLAGLASLEGKARNKAIRDFIKSFPIYAWDNFYWPNERVESSISQVNRTETPSNNLASEGKLPF